MSENGRSRRAVIGLGSLTLISALACYEEPGTGLGRAAVFRAYAADRVYHCPVPFFYTTAGMTHVWEGADLVLLVGDGAELTYYARYGSGDEAINWQADTLRVAGTYERDGAILRFHFDEGFMRPVPMEAEIYEDDRLLAAFPDGSQMEFVPASERPTGPPEYCEA